jgi:hypothetical protein
MVKGKRAFEKIAARFVPQAEINAQQEKKDKSAYEKKIEAIAARFYYYTFYMRKLGLKDTSEVLTKLSGEFYISTYQVMQIVSKNGDIVDSYREKKVTIPQLKTSFSHFVW